MPGIWFVELLLVNPPLCLVTLRHLGSLKLSLNKGLKSMDRINVAFFPRWDRQKGAASSSSPLKVFVAGMTMMSGF